MTLPSRLVEALLDRAFLRRNPAFVAVARNGTILHVGGDWGSYWIAEPVIHTIVTRELPFLVGMLPIGTQAEFLPRVDLGQGRSVDIYLLPAQELDWVLLVDAGDLDLARQFQQARNLDHLLRIQRTPPPPLP